MDKLVWEKAAEQADELRSVYNISTPADPYELCEALGFAVYYAPLGDKISGMIVKNKDEAPEIAINLQDGRLRQRFTLAHEIGHYMERTEVANDEDFSFSDKRGAKYDLHEFFADEFAASFLMPENEVKALHREGRSTVFMAEHFNVSFEAMRMRIGKLTKRNRL